MQRQDGTTFYLPFKGYQGVGVTVAAQAEAAASRSLGFTFNGKPIITDADGRLILQGNTAAPTNTFINGKPLGTDSDGHLMLQGSTTTSTIATTSVSTTSTVNNNVASSSSTAPVYQGNIRVYTYNTTNNWPGTVDVLSRDEMDRRNAVVQQIKDQTIEVSLHYCTT